MIDLTFQKFEYKQVKNKKLEWEDHFFFLGTFATIRRLLYLTIYLHFLLLLPSEM